MLHFSRVTPLYFAVSFPTQLPVSPVLPFPPSIMLLLLAFNPPLQSPRHLFTVPHSLLPAFCKERCRFIGFFSLNDPSARIPFLDYAVFSLCFWFVHLF